ncbi:unnamed protein product, partial [marine sediment metagenome]
SIKETLQFVYDGNYWDFLVTIYGSNSFDFNKSLPA